MAHVRFIREKGKCIADSNIIQAHLGVVRHSSNAPLPAVEERELAECRTGGESCISNIG
jgi:hypothetical protein